MKRCDWSTHSPLEQEYHDVEWGKENHDNRYLFEMLCLEGMQAGLSWHTILNKREGYRELFHNFEIDKIVLMQDEEIEKLYTNPAIIRHKLKIDAIIHNAKLIKTLDLDLNDFLWKYVDYKPIVKDIVSIKDVPSADVISTQISKDLKKLGFKFVGPTTLYAFMQAVGMVNDHINDCDFKFR